LTDRRRIELLDAARGACLGVVMVNHLPENPLRAASFEALGPFGVAPVFLFVSGFVAATLLGRTLAASGFRAAWSRALARAVQVYLAHLVVLAVLVVLAMAGLVNFRRGAPLLGSDPLLAAGLGVFLIHQPAFLGVLPLYAVLIALSPLVLLGARCGQGRRVLAASLLLWLAAQVGFLSLPRDPFGIHFGNFGLAGWQAPYVWGLLAGHRRLSGEPRPLAVPRPVLAAAAIVAILLLALRHSGLYVDAHQELLRPFRGFAQQYALGPVRFLSFAAALPIAAVLLPRVDPWIRGRIPYRFFAFLGRHSLAVFAWSIPVAYLAYTHERQWLASPLALRGLLALALTLALGLPAWLDHRWPRRRKGSYSAPSRASAS
jgi:hypothetical protein